MAKVFPGGRRELSATGAAEREPFRLRVIGNADSGKSQLALLYLRHEYQAFRCQPLPARPRHASAQRVDLGIHLLGYRGYPRAVQAVRGNTLIRQRSEHPGKRHASRRRHPHQALACDRMVRAITARNIPAIGA